MNRVPLALIRFIFSKQFVINLAIAVVLGLLAMVGLYYWLASYTEHDLTLSTPDFTGVRISDLDAFDDTLEVEWVIVDSIYTDDIPKGAVAYQDPVPGYHVKRGRTVYLTVNAVRPRQVAVPNVRNLSFRQAKAVLESVGLKLGELHYRPDIAKNAVLDQRIGDRSVKEGELVVVGTVIDLVLGDGLSNTRVPIPYLLYLTLDEATERLNQASLNLGTFKIDTPVTDTALARVYKQVPAFNEKNLIPMGTSFILFLTEDTLSIEYDTVFYSRTIVPDTLLFDDMQFDDEEIDR